MFIRDLNKSYWVWFQIKPSKWPNLCLLNVPYFKTDQKCHKRNNQLLTKFSHHPLINSALTTLSGNRVKGRQLNNNSSNNNNTGNSNNNEAVSDDDESQDSGDESSPRSGQTQTDSLDTTSEPSLTSPLGHNLHSLGSPASPHLGGSSVAPMASLDDWGNYYRSASYHRSSFPVFPLLTSASPSPKPPVGNDPRDSKNPLSVWQLTGRSQSRTPLESQHRVNEGDVNGICGAQVNGVRRFLWRAKILCRENNFSTQTALKLKCRDFLCRPRRSLQKCDENNKFNLRNKTNDEENNGVRWQRFIFLKTWTKVKKWVIRWRLFFDRKKSIRFVSSSTLHRIASDQTKEWNLWSQKIKKYPLQETIL